MPCPIRVAETEASHRLLRPLLYIFAMILLAVTPHIVRAQSNASLEESINSSNENAIQLESLSAEPEPNSIESSKQAEQPRSLSTAHTVCAMTVGVVVVLSLMIGLKTHAFVALILGTLAISLFIPADIVGFEKLPQPHVIKGASDPANIVTRVTNSFGASVGGIGILIAMASIIGKCMLISGAAEQIVQSTLRIIGERRAAVALMGSGFVLSIPVFFDTVFYLLVPLARSLYRQTQKNYLLYLAAIAAGGAITHTLVPPTPGPLLVANALKVDLGIVMVVGLLIAAPSAFIGLLAAKWLNRRMVIPIRQLSSDADDGEYFERLPSLFMSLVPVLLPVLLITLETIFSRYVSADSPSVLQAFRSALKFLGNANFAMILAAIFSIFLCWKVQLLSWSELAEEVDDSLLSGGVIILITAAGGAFGGLLAMTEIQLVVESWFEGLQSGGVLILFIAYGLSAMLKIAQGSSTVAMIIASSLVSSLALPLVNNGTLGYHPAYLVSVIGAGSLMGSWMNDSGFWIFAKMGGLTESETLRSWTVVLAVLSLSAFTTALTLSLLMPLA